MKSLLIIIASYKITSWLLDWAFEPAETQH